MDRSSLLAPAYTKEMRASLLAGENLAAMMGKLGFSDDVVTQLSLAELHGNTQGSLLKIEAYLAHLMTVKRKLWEVATYPIILLTFLILIMLGLRNYLLPQLERTNLATRIINHFPLVFLIGVLVLALVILCLIWLQRRSRKITWYSRLARLPLLGRFVQLYLTAYYAREWGNLLGQGIDLLDLVSLMQEQKSKLFRELGADLEEALMLGQSFPDRIATHPFFTKELSLIIAYGEANARLGYELEVYAEEVWQAFFNRLNKATTFVQPLIFVIVAVVIVMIYAAMLLPMYQNMEGMMS